MDKLKTLVVNGLFVGLLYLAGVMKIPGAINLLIFSCWFIFVLAILIFMASSVSNEYKEEIKNKDYAFSQTIDIIYDLAYTAGLVWFGFIWSGVAYITANLIIHGLKNQGD